MSLDHLDHPYHRDLSDRICAAEFEAMEHEDYAAATMLGDICREWTAGRMLRANVEIALAGWVKRRDAR